MNEYEGGIKRELKGTCYSSGGQVITTITTEVQHQSLDISDAKKPKMLEATVESTSSGYV